MIIGAVKPCDGGMYDIVYHVAAISIPKKFNEVKDVEERLWHKEAHGERIA